MIPFVDLKAQYIQIKPEIDSAVASVLARCQFVLGDEVAAFEKEFAIYCGARHAIAVNSGTSALHLSMLAAGIAPGDEIITVPFTFVATVAAVYYTGARPVLVDIDPRSYTINVSQIEAAITERTKAIVPVHLYGQAADMDPILAIARRHGLVVIEDAAQAHGAEYKGQRVGGIGDLGCFSFYPSKNLGAYGEGGMIVTDNPDFAQAIYRLRDWGQDERYHHLLKGYNYRMDELQAAILRVKLRHLKQWTERRRSHAARYDELLAGSNIQTPEVMPCNRHVYHIYAVRVPKRDAVREALRRGGIQTGIHYPSPVHLQPAYAELAYRPGDFPQSEAAAEEVLSLPMFAELTAEQQQHVVSAIRPVLPQCKVTHTANVFI
jgi:dTDP-4-amino-4,6-dideoxygalactose transaminase